MLLVETVRSSFQISFVISYLRKEINLQDKLVCMTGGLDAHTYQVVQEYLACRL